MGALSIMLRLSCPHLLPILVRVLLPNNQSPPLCVSPAKLVHLPSHLPCKPGRWQLSPFYR